MAVVVFLQLPLSFVEFVWHVRVDIFNRRIENGQKMLLVQRRLHVRVDYKHTLEFFFRFAK